MSKINSVWKQYGPLWRRDVTNQDVLSVTWIFGNLSWDWYCWEGNGHCFVSFEINSKPIFEFDYWRNKHG